jgi:hypothetical protein
MAIARFGTGEEGDEIDDEEKRKMEALRSVATVIVPGEAPSEWRRCAFGRRKGKWELVREIKREQSKKVRDTIEAFTALPFSRTCSLEKLDEFVEKRRERRIFLERLEETCPFGALEQPSETKGKESRELLLIKELQSLVPEGVIESIELLDKETMHMRR